MDMYGALGAAPTTAQDQGAVTTSAGPTQSSITPAGGSWIAAGAASVGQSAQDATYRIAAGQDPTTAFYSQPAASRQYVAAGKKKDEGLPWYVWAGGAGVVLLVGYMLLRPVSAPIPRMAGLGRAGRRGHGRR